MISNNEMMRIRRQMQRRIRGVIAERRHARRIEPPKVEPAETAAETRPGAEASLVANACPDPSPHPALMIKKLASPGGLRGDANSLS